MVLSDEIFENKFEMFLMAPEFSPCLTQLGPSCQPLAMAGISHSERAAMMGPGGSMPLGILENLNPVATGQFCIHPE